MPSNQRALDEEVFVAQQNEINQAINNSRVAISKPSDVVECIDCGDEIPPKRKLAMPSTERCIFCAELAEKRKPTI